MVVSSSYMVDLHPSMVVLLYRCIFFSRSTLALPGTADISTIKLDSLSTMVALMLDNEVLIWKAVKVYLVIFSVYKTLIFSSYRAKGRMGGSRRPTFPKLVS